MARVGFTTGVPREKARGSIDVLTERHRNFTPTRWMDECYNKELGNLLILYIGTSWAFVRNGNPLLTHLSSRILLTNPACNASAAGNLYRTGGA